MLALIVVSAVLVLVVSVKSAYRMGVDDGHDDGFEQGLKCADARAKMWSAYEQGF